MRNIYTGIDIGSDSIKIVVSEFLNGKYNVLASTNVKTAGVKKGLIVDKELVSNALKLAIKEIEPSLGVKIDKAIITVPSNDRRFSVVSGNAKVKDEDEITGEDIVSSLEEAVIDKINVKESLVTVVPITFSVDEKEGIFDPKGMPGEYLEAKAVLATAPKKNIFPFIEVVTNCGIDIMDIVFGSIGDYYEARNKDMDKSLGAIINIGSETINVSIFNKGIIIKEDNIDLGSKNIDKDISYVYGVDLTTSRTLKENFAVCSRRYADANDVLEIETKNGDRVIVNQYEISEIVESRVVELLKLAKKVINNLTKRKISYIIVTGGISELIGFSYVVENTLGINASTLNITTIGIRNNKYSSASGIIKYYHEKMQLREIDGSMFDIDKIEEMLNNKSNMKKTTNDTIVSKVFGYFIGN